jgi:hypothetical protein
MHQMTRRLDYATLNMELVARGVRRGWTADDVSMATLKRKAGGMPLAMYAVAVPGAPKVSNAILVLREDDATPLVRTAVTNTLTHVQLAELLGLPCASAKAWEDPALCYALIVEVVPIGRCRADHKNYVTSFWCAERAQVLRWVAAFKRKSAVFEREQLAPRGLKFLYRLDQVL